MLSNNHRPIEEVVRRSCAAADPSQPYARQLEQVAHAAIGLGLELAHRRPLLGPAVADWRERIDLAVESFAAPSCQDELHWAAHQAGVVPAEVLSGIVLRHCQGDLRPLTTEQVARYALEFALALTDARPALAEQYRRWLSRSG